MPPKPRNSSLPDTPSPHWEVIAPVHTQPSTRMRVRPRESIKKRLATSHNTRLPNGTRIINLGHTLALRGLPRSQKLAVPSFPNASIIFAFLSGASFPSRVTARTRASFSASIWDGFKSALASFMWDCISETHSRPSGGRATTIPREESMLMPRTIGREKCMAEGLLVR